MAAVEDKGFNLKVKRREINFACGDMLKVMYFTQQKFRNDNLIKETVVTRVIEVIVQPQQIKLDFEQEE